MFLNKFKVPQGSFRERAPYIIGGAIVGVLILWLAVKLITPAVRSVCKIVLRESTELGHREGREVPVEAAVVNQGNISRRVVTVGRLRANNEVMLKAEVSGRINEFTFQEGSTVQKGDVLIKFDDLDTRASLKQAEAEYTLHKAEYERILNLHSKNIQSTKQLDEIRAKRDIAEAKVEEIKATLEKKTILAPFAGTIGIMAVSSGSYLQAGQDLAMLVDATPIKVDFKVPEKHIHDIGPGQVAEVTFDGLKDQTFRFTVEAVNSKVDEQSHSVALRASNPNEGNLLRPGLFAKVSLIIGDKADAILIPETALHREGDVEFVWTIEKGKAIGQRVIAGTRENGKIEVVAGIRPGVIVITAGQMRISEGARVKITNMPESELKAAVENEKKTEAEKDNTENKEKTEDKPQADGEDNK